MGSNDDAGAWGDALAGEYDSMAISGDLSTATMGKIQSLPWFQNQLRVLDFGCGTGMNSIKLASETGADVAAADTSTAMIEQVHRKLENLRPQISSRIHPIVCSPDASDIVADPEYDMILCSFVLHHVGDLLEPILVNLRQAMTKKNCRLCIFELEDSQRTRDAFDRKRALLCKHGSKPHIKVGRINNERMREYLEQAGFCIEYLEQGNVQTMVGDSSEIVDFYFYVAQRKDI
uniref:Methyltransferase type 12 domain-containing protein n=1 Tax=Spongospora subterranea TaxID=70186 RepID=A0A0H5RBQ4_9EUKA|eukprot:CRZ11216.1 hypothetical protein [Spongospora subterranea]